VVEDLGYWLSGDRRHGLSVAMSSGEHVVCPMHGLPRDYLGLQFQCCGFAGHERMNSRICRCCGEPMPEKGNALSRNPNICASCSSMADGMEESSVPESSRPAAELVEATTLDRIEESAAQAVHHGPM
jgi:hypothetical protein